MPKKKDENCDFIWQDREIRFDVQLIFLQLRKGEIMVDSIGGVEDTKGNNGDQGKLIITNLRLIWFSDVNNKTNLSIGYDNMVAVEIKNANSRLRGNVQALHIRSRQAGTRYEFIFTSLLQGSPRLFTSFQAVVRSYETTKLYRDLKLRGAIIQEKQLAILPQEQIYHMYNGVWNLSAEQGNLGTMYVTNVRIVWYANLAENFNVSVPYIQIKSIKVRESKFGTAMVIETSPLSGGYILGFKMEEMQMIYKEVNALYKLYFDNPILGVQVKQEEANEQLKTILQQINEDVEIVDTAESSKQASALYYITQQESQGQSEIFYVPEIGLAIEKLPAGFQMESLWKIL